MNLEYRPTYVEGACLKASKRWRDRDGKAVAGWLRDLLAKPQGLLRGVVSPQPAAMATFARLILQQPALPQAEFQCVASDFSRICRGKLGPESLDRYVQKAG